MAAVKCTRIGCNATYDPSQNDAAECNFHPGAPLFHEGLKSYSCCNTINKPVMTFDEFLKLPGCTTGSHSSEKTEVKAPVVTAKVQENNVETVASSVVDVPLVASTSTLSAGPTVYKSRPTSPNPPTSNGSSAPSAVLLEEQDPVDAVVPEGTKCKRAACGCAYTTDMERTDAECLYHPLPAIFHEGSKGYACCKRRVLEFDEFLKIEGCKKGRHLFVGQPKAGVEMVTCRSDMYQTPTQVIASVFGKQADKEKSNVKFEEWELGVDLHLPSNKRFTKSYNLYGPIKPEASTFRILGTKVEITLVKADGRSWPSLEAAAGKQAFTPQITFGVQGRTGTVGSKDMIYNGDVVHS